MSSSTQNNFPNIHAATSAPPPTPSSQPQNHHHLTSPAAVDALSRLLHRLPPTLSLPTRRPSISTTSIHNLPVITSLSGDTSGDHLLSAASQLGFFQLTNPNISPDLASSAESESIALFELSSEQKHSCFPRNWPTGFEDEEDGNGESFWLDDASFESSKLSLSSLREFTRALEKTGLEILEMLSGGVGFENPLKEDPTRMCSLMVLHKGKNGDKPDVSGGSYPYIVGLEYVFRSQKYSLLADSGWVSVQPQPESIMVTLGDIAQVWSNGKLKKVRGRALACNNNDNNNNIIGLEENNSKCLSMKLLITLPIETTLSPLLSNPNLENEEDGEISNGIMKKQKRLYKSFLFEDYAWRVYHDPLLFKDPLDRYRI
ncbi:2-oxoglutarate (2OG) and Fe(II)-dependent oxygenase superfamily protein [Euphorbia peplus]|nr:2-oxoglutarate (2OG) and Fe(II)-dependent oxygenase superfamily protein [Euphorbia peplus]